MFFLLYIWREKKKSAIIIGIFPFFFFSFLLFFFYILHITNYWQFSMSDVSSIIYSVHVAHLFVLCLVFFACTLYRILCIYMSILKVFLNKNRRNREKLIFFPLSLSLLCFLNSCWIVCWLSLIVRFIVCFVLLTNESKLENNVPALVNVQLH